MQIFTFWAKIKGNTKTPCGRYSSCNNYRIQENKQSLLMLHVLWIKSVDGFVQLQRDGVTINNKLLAKVGKAMRLLPWKLFCRFSHAKLLWWLEGIRDGRRGVQQGRWVHITFEKLLNSCEKTGKYLPRVLVDLSETTAVCIPFH